MQKLLTTTVGTTLGCLFVAVIAIYTENIFCSYYCGLLRRSWKNSHYSHLPTQNSETGLVYSEFYMCMSKIVTLTNIFSLKKRFI